MGGMYGSVAVGYGKDVGIAGGVLWDVCTSWYIQSQHVAHIQLNAYLNDASRYAVLWCVKVKPQRVCAGR